MNPLISQKTYLDFLLSFNYSIFCTIQVKIPLYGCDCYAYALLSSGFVDLVVESGLKVFRTLYCPICGRLFLFKNLVSYSEKNSDD
jgi:hypothetical protein